MVETRSSLDNILGPREVQNGMEVTQGSDTDVFRDAENFAHKTEIAIRNINILCIEEYQKFKEAFGDLNAAGRYSGKYCDINRIKHSEWIRSILVEPHFRNGKQNTFQLRNRVPNLRVINKTNNDLCENEEAQCGVCDRQELLVGRPR